MLSAIADMVLKRNASMFDDAGTLSLCAMHSCATREVSASTFGQGQRLIVTKMATERP